MIFMRGKNGIEWLLPAADAIKLEQSAETLSIELSPYLRIVIHLPFLAKGLLCLSDLPLIYYFCCYLYAAVDSHLSYILEYGTLHASRNILVFRGK